MHKKFIIFESLILTVAGNLNLDVTVFHLLISMYFYINGGTSGSSTKSAEFSFSFLFVKFCLCETLFLLLSFIIFLKSTLLLSSTSKYSFFFSFFVSTSDSFFGFDDPCCLRTGCCYYLKDNYLGFNLKTNKQTSNVPLAFLPIADQWSVNVVQYLSHI